MSGEALQRPKIEFEPGHIPGRAIEIANKVFALPAYAFEDLIFSRHIVTNEVPELLNRWRRKLSPLFKRIGSHLIEGARHSCYINGDGSYEKVDDYFRSHSSNRKVHDICHSAVAYELQGCPQPSFFSAPSQIESWKLIQEELYTLLLWKFHEDCLCSELEYALNSFFIRWHPGFLSFYQDESKKENRDLQTAKYFFEVVYEQFHKRPDPAFMARARRIYDGIQRGEYDIGAKELEATLRQIPPHP